MPLEALIKMTTITSKLMITNDSEDFILGYSFYIATIAVIGVVEILLLLLLNNMIDETHLL